MSRKEKRRQEEREAKERKKAEKQNKKNVRRKHNITKIEEVSEITTNIETLDEIKIENSPNEKEKTRHEDNSHTKKEKKKLEKERKKQEKEEKKKNRNIIIKILLGILKTIFVIILILVLLIVLYIGKLGFQSNWDINKMLKKGAKEVALFVTGQTEADVANLDPLYFLIMGVSTDEGLLLTDTIIVCAYYPKTQEASMLSIPRDTFVGKSEATAGGYDKINSVFQSGGGGKAGAEKLLATVEKLVGLEIDNYIVVRNEGLIEIIDAIGGIDFNVPIDMKYDDFMQDLHIDLKAGMQRIDGPKAEQLLRFRHNNDYTTYPAEYGGEDIGRTRTQRAFITETIRQTLKLKNVTKINDLIKIAFDNTETNMDIDYIMKYSPAAIDFDVAAIQEAYLPGVPANLGPIPLSFYKADKAKTKAIIDDMFTFKQKESESHGDGENILKPEYIKLQVLNGCGDNEVFKETTKRLENKGYKIKEIGETTYSKTTKIINRTEKKEEVIDELIDTLGYGYESKGKVSTSYDITIVVGQDMLQYMKTTP